MCDGAIIIIKAHAPGTQRALFRVEHIVGPYQYKDQVYSKTIQQICEGIPSLSKEVKDQCFVKVKDYFHRSPENVTIKELLLYKEFSFEIAMLITKIKYTRLMYIML